MTWQRWSRRATLCASLVAGGAATHAQVHTGPDVVLVHVFRVPDGEAWGTVAIDLAAGAWHVGSASGPLAGEAQLRGTLRALSRVRAMPACNCNCSRNCVIKPTWTVRPSQKPVRRSKKKWRRILTVSARGDARRERLCRRPAIGWKAGRWMIWGWTISAAPYGARIGVAVKACAVRAQNRPPKISILCANG